MRIVREHKLVFTGLIIAIAGSIVLTLLPPLLLEKLVNELVAERSISITYALLYFLILVMSGICDSVKETLITVFGQKITHGQRSDMCQKLSRLPADYYTQHSAGGITSRFVNDVDTVDALFSNGIIGMCVDICNVVCILGIIFCKSLGLGLLLIATIPVLYLLTRRFQKKMLAAQKKNRVVIAQVNNYIPETIAHIRTIHSLVKESYMEKKYDEKIQSSYRAVEKSNLYDSIYSPIVILMSTIIIAMVMILSAMDGQVRSFFGMSVGTAVAVIAYVGKVFDPIESIGMEIQNIQSALAGVSRIKELMAEAEQEPADESMTMEDLLRGREQGVCIDQVTFAYDEKQDILHRFSMQIPSGDMVTLVGRTGAGKSTLFKLMLGLYLPQRGSVRIYGQEAHKIPNTLKRRLFGYVEQSFHPVPGTVAEQISLYDTTLSREEIVEAAKLVEMDEMIEKLPQGYDTDCSTVNFSQGQLQLLSIARVVVTNPSILLLDEITASLDSITEHMVIEALERAVQGRTVISISHRLYENMGNRLIQISD